MAPRVPSAAGHEQTSRARAEARARRLCGSGPLVDVVDPTLLKKELTAFYGHGVPRDASPGLVAVNRAKRAFDRLSDVAQGPDRISKGTTRTLWALLLEEMKFAINHNVTAFVEPLVRFLETTRREARQNHSWDMGRVRHVLAGGWPSDFNITKLKSQDLGPLHWWLGARKIADKEPLTRQHIYDAAYALRTITNSSRRRSPTPAAAVARSSSRPSRQAASATNDALSSTIILDDDLGGTYAPSDVGNDDGARDVGNDDGARNVGNDGGARDVPASVRQTPWAFGQGATAAFTATAPPQAPVMPPPPPPAPGATRRAQPSPWLPPSGFTAELKWNIEDYNVHKAQLLSHPRGVPIPEGFLWEHPALHGLQVSEDGQAKMFEASLASPVDFSRLTIGVACLPCYWEKGSQGKCEGGRPPSTPVPKPDFAVRKAFLEELDRAGVYEFPSHIINRATGRGRRGADSGGTGGPPSYDPPAPRYSPARPAAEAETETPPSTGNPQVPGITPQDAAPEHAGPTATPEPARLTGPRPVHASHDENTAEPVSAVTPAADDGDEHIPPATEDGPPPEDVAMADVSNAPSGARKRRRQQVVGAGDNPDLASVPAQPSRKRARKHNSVAPQEGQNARAPSGPPAPRARPALPIPPRPRPMLPESESEDAGDARSAQSATPTTESEHQPTPVPTNIGPPKGKGKGRAVPRPSGTQQRSAANRGIQFHDNVPGTRPVSRAGSPVFRARPWPVIPDRDMQVSGDRTYEIPTGVSRISYPHPTPLSTSTVNVSGDILLANHVERAMRHEVRDIRNEVREIRDQDRDWLSGRYQTDFVMPRHREVLESVRELREEVRGFAKSAGMMVAPPQASIGDQLSPAPPAAPERLPQAPHVPGISTGHSSTLLVPAPAPPTPSQPSSGDGFSHMFQDLQTNLQNSFANFSEEMQRSLAERTAPIADLRGSVQDLTTRFGELAPISGRVDEMGRNVEALSSDLRVLVGRVQRLEDVGPLSSNLRVFAEQHDRLGAAPAPVLVLRQPVVPQTRRTPPVAEAPGAFQPGIARSLTPATPPNRRAVSSVAAPAMPSVSPSAALAPAPASDPVHTPDRALLRTTQDPAARLLDAISRDRDLLSMIPADAPPPGSFDASQAIPQSSDGALAMDIDAVSPHSPGGLSPLTTSPSPGRQIVQSPPVLGAARKSSSPASDGESGHSSGETGEDDVPMETGEDWAPGSRKRPAENTADSPSDRAAKRQASAAYSDTDEDAEGSSDDQEEAATVNQPPVPASRPAPSRAGKGRGAGGVSTAAAGGRGRGRGRREGLRNRG
ncbi:unnamed protein product [Peniophora sp. CBMAI 1063]|nr:unnamed protein product [Peniophora sp. CBMAI 1063]